MSRRAGLAAGCLALLLARAAGAATVFIDNRDGPGEGFNDPTPFVPVGGNPATTLGQARLLAFQHAGSLWGARLASGVTITVEASIDSLTCTQFSAVLGAAGTKTIHREFPGAPLAATWYPQALANALSGLDLDPANADIQAMFNGQLDTGACLGGTRWYYGFNGAPPGDDIDFVTVVLHELGHGLGFQTFVGLTNGAKLAGFDDMYMRLLEHHGATPSGYPPMTDAQRAAANVSDPNLHWLGTRVNTAGASLLVAGVAGGHVRMNAPNPSQQGSSLSHFSTALEPSQLMEPFYTGPDHDTSFTLKLLADIGWPLAPSVARVPASSGWSAGVLAMALAGAAALVLRRRAPRRGASRRRG